MLASLSGISLGWMFKALNIKITMSKWVAFFVVSIISAGILELIVKIRLKKNNYKVIFMLNTEFRDFKNMIMLIKNSRNSSYKRNSILLFILWNVSLLLSFLSFIFLAK